MVCSTSMKCGRSCGSYCHKLFMRRKREAGHSGGRGRRSPSSILLMTSSFLIPTNGFTPRIRISQQHTPVRRRTEGGGGGGGGGEGGGREGGGEGGGGGKERRRRRDIHSRTQKMVHVSGRTKHPHVTESCESSEVDTLWSHPFYGQLSS